MKAKNQQHYTSEIDAKEKLIVYVYEYLIHAGAKPAADLFKENIGYHKDIKVNMTETTGFLLDWWCVFWDLYCAAPERRHNQPESSRDAQAFHDYMRTPMSPSITQTSPPQQQPPPPQFLGGPRYGPPPGQPRGPPPRMQGPPPQHGGPPHQGPPSGFMPAANPRYAQHSGPPPPHMNQGGPMGFGPGHDHQMGPSPGLNRMTPVGGPPPQQQQQVVGPPPPSGPPPQIVGMPQGQQMSGPPPGQGPSQPMHGAGPPRNGSQGNVGGWTQSNVNYGNVNSPHYSGPGSNQPSQGGPMMMSDGSMMEVKSSSMNGVEASTPNPEEYVLPGPFGQDTSDQCESAEILKLKQSMQEDTTKMFEKEQSDFGLAEYSDSHGKWS